MLVISRTPLRVSFFGGGTDYPAHYQKRGGAVLGTTIDHYTYITVKSFNSSFFDHNIRIGYSRTEQVKHIEEIQHPSIRACLQHRGSCGQLEVQIFADLPAKTGLGSSSSFTVGFLHALSALKGEKISKAALAKEACHVEHHLLKENVGSQDQYHAAYGGLNRISFTNQSIRVHPLVLSNENHRHLEQHLMLFYTGVTRFATKVAQEQVEKTERGDNLLALEAMQAMVYEAETVLKEEKGERLLMTFGALLDKSWRLKKTLSSKVTTPLIEEALLKAKKAGAYGGKLCGAGSGGFITLVVPREAQTSVNKALAPFCQVPFHFEKKGSQIIYCKGPKHKETEEEYGSTHFSRRTRDALARSC